MFDQFNRHLTVDDASHCLTQEVSRLWREEITGLSVVTMVSTSGFNQNLIFMLGSGDEGTAHVAISHETVTVTVHFVEQDEDFILGKLG